MLVFISKCWLKVEDASTAPNQLVDIPACTPIYRFTLIFQHLLLRASVTLLQHSRNVSEASRRKKEKLQLTMCHYFPKHNCYLNKDEK